MADEQDKVGRAESTVLDYALPNQTDQKSDTSSFVLALVVEFVLLCLSGVVLDGGMLLTFFSAGFLLFWILAGLKMFKTRNSTAAQYLCFGIGVAIACLGFFVV